MIDITEQEIMKNWKTGNQIMVSIICNTYNHEDYIGEAIDSFLMQKTGFSFEVLINDDVSTDRTIEILKQYESKFSNIIKPIYQSENQFSQGISPMAYLFSKAKGKYVAICEGDDYWVDENKLQIQLEEMEKHPEVDMSFHPAYRLLESQRKGVLSKHSFKNCIFTPQQVILGGGSFCPTASLMFRKRLVSSLPDWLYTSIPADYIFQIMGSVVGGALFINRCMSIYRNDVAGSWSNNMALGDSEKKRKFLFHSNDRLKQINNMLDKKFQKEINQAINNKNYNFIKMKSTELSVKKEVYNLYKDEFSMKQKILWHLLYRNKSFRNMLSRTKSLIIFQRN